ncbi:aromatic ring-hydroxylating dioxygenase subunit alpha [Alkalihalobacillus sp. MEB130]|uniref:aromatic ring-hydroxylating oxygenase subunit alpha n=1 Tax=Alkalihalobacillus sp. MEB130 TaxID=2976704 RepID=UPI0028DF5FEF|nr:aromatic ring-hydroxylating dioxygenase subunit alpha [Alkalihalobacillus sp. MEB130]MDT8861305.1 aromatic ring-hydroxylating dioxygenase subunit alpha [Alkalihalobacillus sp. MEB130]
MLLNENNENQRGKLAATLTGELYTSQDVFQLEQENIFSKSWMFVGYSYEVTEPGQYLTTKIGNENVLVVRGRDGELRAFLNVCRHRGATLCSEQNGKVGKTIRCPYHNWSYGLNGALMAVPNTSDCKEELVNNDEYGLYEVHLRTWHGMIWLNLDEQALPVEQQLNTQLFERFGELSTFARYQIEDLKIGAQKEYEVDANWKLIIENFQECYHCSSIHPELTATLPEFRSGVGTQNTVGGGATFHESVQSFSLSGKGKRKPLKGLLPEDDRTYFGITLLPHVFVNLTPDHVIIHRLIPISETKTRVVCDWLFAPEEIEKSDFDPTDAVELFHRVNEQDFEACEWCQENMGSKAYKSGGILVPIEHHVSAFYNYVMKSIGMITT